MNIPNLLYTGTLNNVCREAFNNLVLGDDLQLPMVVGIGVGLVVECGVAQGRHSCCLSSHKDCSIP